MNPNPDIPPTTGTIRTVTNLTARTALTAIATLAALATLIATTLSVAHAYAGTPIIEPSGYQKSVDQIRIKFDKNMVVLSDGKAEAPATVTCSFDTKTPTGYWADTKLWVYPITEKTQPGGGVCHTTLKPGLSSLKGESVSTASSVVHIIGPAVKYQLPGEGSVIEEEGSGLIFAVNQPVNLASIEKHGYCAAKGIVAKIPLKVMTGAAKYARLNAVYSYLRENLENVASTYALAQSEPTATDDLIVVVTCATPLPSNTPVTLVWGKGIQAKNGKNALEVTQSFEFKTRSELTAQVTCSRENAKAPCSPFGGIEVKFPEDTQITEGMLKTVVIRNKKTKKEVPVEVQDYRNSVRTSIEVLAPNTDYEVTVPRNFKDESGRSLVNAGKFPITLRVGEFPPLLKFAADFGIIEQHTGGVLPLTVRMLEKSAQGSGVANVRWVTTKDKNTLITWDQAWDPGREKPWVYDNKKNKNLGAIEERPIPITGEPKDFEVVGLPLEKFGYFLVEGKSDMLGKSLLGKTAPMYVRSKALVTNMGVHLKRGTRNTLVWVTDLKTGKPVESAKVTIINCKTTQKSTDKKVLGEATTAKDGVAVLVAGTYNESCGYAFAEKDGDLSFTKYDWDDGIEPWRFNMDSYYNDLELAKLQGHTIMDRTLFKAGETAHFLNIARDQKVQKLEYAQKYPATMVIVHPDSKITYKSLTWTNGQAPVTWDIPTTAKRGAYQVKLVMKKVTDASATAELEYMEGVSTTTFTVADFKLPQMKVTLTPEPGNLVHETESGYTVTGNWLSGGVANKLPVELKGFAIPTNCASVPKQPDDYTFCDNQYQGNYELTGQTTNLDKAGQSKINVSGINPEFTTPQRIHTEIEYLDPNGELQTISNSRMWYPSKQVVGIKRMSWLSAKSKIALDFMVLDLNGNTVPFANIDISLSQSITRVTRIRGVGGLYRYESSKEDVTVTANCPNKTDKSGKMTCTITPDKRGGEITINAATEDSVGTHTAKETLWVSGNDYVWFDSENADRMDVLSEKKEYEPGDTLKLQIRMPFKNATVLLTAEHNGVVTYQVSDISSKDAVAKLKVEENWAPNIFVSALAVTGRTDDPPATALVDLGKPAFKLGITEIKVGYGKKRIGVKASVEKPVYEIREKANVRYTVKPAKPGDPMPIVVIAVVDQALLELKKNETWAVLDAMMAEKPYLVRTATSQSRVVGKRHFGKKALPAGGGGGGGTTRKIFDTLLYWNPNAPLDKNGNGSIEVPIKDSLTTYKVVVMALGESTFGTGQTEFKTSQDVQIIPGMMLSVRESDKTKNYATIRNGSAHEVTMTVTAKVNEKQLNTPKVFTLEPGEGKEVSWNYTVPTAIKRLDWELEAKSSGGKTDKVRITQDVTTDVPVRLMASTMHRITQESSVPVTVPTGAVEANYEVTLSNSLVGSLAGVKSYMQSYPYSCMEQKTSKAIVSGNPAEWDKLMAELPNYLDDSGLLRYYPAGDKGSVVLTSYVLSIAPEAGKLLPLDAKRKMLTALDQYVTGKLQEESEVWMTPTMGASNKIAAIAALARHGVANKGHVTTISVAPEIMSTASLLDWITVLKYTKAPEPILERAESALSARVSYSGNRVVVGNSDDSYEWWGMMTANGVASKTLLYATNSGNWKTNAPKLANGLVVQQEKGRWGTTTDNAWGATALRKYASIFEKEKVTGETAIELAKTTASVTWSSSETTKLLPAVTGNLKIKHMGNGAPYATINVNAAVRNTTGISRGYNVTREYIPVEQKKPGEWSRGDIAKVLVHIEAAHDMGWVVLEDAVPPGAVVLGKTGIDRQSSFTAAESERSSRWWSVWDEVTASAYRSYANYVYKGDHTIEYTVRLNNEGTFTLPPARVEAMYAPEFFGESREQHMTVGN